MGKSVMITLFTNKELLSPENRSAVHPLLFDLYYYEDVHPSVQQHYTIVDDSAMADCYIFPLEYVAALKKGYKRHYQELYELAVAQHKKLMVYTGGDYGITFNDATIITWRNAGFKSLNDAQTIVVPAFMNDPLQREDVDFQLHAYQESPQVSFTGFANLSLEEQLRSRLSTLKGNVNRMLKNDKSDAQSFYNAAGKRYEYLKTLESNSQIITDFIYRNKYRAGAITLIQREQTTQEFFKNLNNSPYTFCLRGAGNFSVRFYEAIACGRIPVLIDTDVQLPLEDIITWEEHICRVLPHENVCDKLLEFHNSQSVHSFEELQRSNRLLYENYLVRHAYFCKLQNTLKNLL